MKLPSLEKLKMISGIVGPLFPHSSKLQELVGAAEAKHGEVVGLAVAVRDHWGRAKDAATQLGLLKAQLPPEAAEHVEAIEQAITQITAAAVAEVEPAMAEAVDDPAMEDVDGVVANEVVAEVQDAV